VRRQECWAAALLAAATWAGCSAPRPEQKAAEKQPAGPNLNLYRYVVAGRAGAPPVGVSVAASPADDFSGAIAPDAKWFAYLSRQSGSTEVWLARSNGNDARMLSAFSGAVEPSAPAWSADAKWIVVADRKEPRLIVLPSGGGAAREVKLPGVCTHPFFAPDAGTVYCVDPAAAQLCRVSVSGSRFDRLRTGVRQAALEQEGSDQTVLFSNGPDSGIWSAAPAGGPARPFARLGGDGMWRVSRDAVFIADLAARTLVRIDRETGQAGEVFEFPRRMTLEPGAALFDAARDETWYLLTIRDGSPAAE
jgi:hypothetical protein